MAYGFMFYALQEQAKKHGYMILRVDADTFGTDADQFAVVNLVDERLVSIEPDIDEVADLLGGICTPDAQRKAENANSAPTTRISIRETPYTPTKETASASFIHPEPMSESCRQLIAALKHTAPMNE